MGEHIRPSSNHTKFRVSDHEDILQISTNFNETRRGFLPCLHPSQSSSQNWLSVGHILVDSSIVLYIFPFHVCTSMSVCLSLTFYVTSVDWLSKMCTYNTFCYVQRHCNIYINTCILIFHECSPFLMHNDATRRRLFEFLTYQNKNKNRLFWIQ